jgi:hypothetical protein
MWFQNHTLSIHFSIFHNNILIEWFNNFMIKKESWKYSLCIISQSVVCEKMKDLQHMATYFPNFPKVHNMCLTSLNCWVIIPMWNFICYFNRLYVSIRLSTYTVIIKSFKTSFFLYKVTKSQWDYWLTKQ